MSIAALQADKFKKEIIDTRKVFTFTENDEYLVFAIGEKDVVPFWSNRGRLEKIQETHAKYKKYIIKELPFEEFYDWLQKLSEDKIHIGTNWIGKKLVGYDLDAMSIKNSLDYLLSK